MRERTPPNPKVFLLWALSGIVVLAALIIMVLVIFGSDSSNTEHTKAKPVVINENATNEVAGLNVQLHNHQVTLTLTKTSLPDSISRVRVTCGYRNGSEYEVITSLVSVSKAKTQQGKYLFTTNLKGDTPEKVQWCGLSWPDDLTIPGAYAYFAETSNKTTVSGESSAATLTLEGAKLSVQLKEGAGSVLANAFSGQPVQATCSFSAQEALSVSASAQITWPEDSTSAVFDLPLDMSADAQECLLQLMSGPTLTRQINSTFVDNLN